MILLLVYFQLVCARAFFFSFSSALSLSLHMFPLKTYGAYQMLRKTKWNVIASLKARNTFIHRDIFDWCMLLVLMSFHCWIIIIENRIYTKTYWLRHKRTNQIYPVWLCQHKIDNKKLQRTTNGWKKKMEFTNEWNVGNWRRICSHFIFTLFLRIFESVHRQRKSISNQKEEEEIKEEKNRLHFSRFHFSFFRFFFSNLHGTLNIHSRTRRKSLQFSNNNIVEKS